MGDTASLNPVINEWGQYDPESDTWTKKANGPWEFTQLKALSLTTRDI